jgi:hypothetical protein
VRRIWRRSDSGQADAIETGAGAAQSFAMYLRHRRLAIGLCIAIAVLIALSASPRLVSWVTCT